MSDKQVRVIGKQRPDVDLKLLAEALLNFIDSLSEAEQRTLAKPDSRCVPRKREGSATQGTAA
jgi:hypothetical protein